MHPGGRLKRQLQPQGKPGDDKADNQHDEHNWAVRRVVAAQFKPAMIASLGNGQEAGEQMAAPNGGSGQ